MKKIIFASIITAVAAIVFVFMTKKAAYGDFSNMKSYLHFIWICLAIAGAIVLWIQIPLWVQGIKNWMQRPKWRR